MDHFHTGDDNRPNADRQAAAREQGRELWREAELQRLVAEIGARLRKPCAHLSPDEFAKLVLDIAHKRMRFDGMDPITGQRRGTQL